MILPETQQFLEPLHRLPKSPKDVWMFAMDLRQRLKIGNVLSFSSMGHL